MAEAAAAAAAERVVEWVEAASASAPSVDNEFRTSRAHRALTSAAPDVAWQWCVKARPTTRRSKAVAPSVSRRAERRASSCRLEIDPDRWEEDR